MPWPKPTAQDRQDRRNRAVAWRDFRKNNLFTQKRLAEVMGVSRRTVQQVEAGDVTPHPDTLRLFLALKQKYADNATYSQRGKRRSHG